MSLLLALTGCEGPVGESGKPCTVAEAGGAKTISCPDGTNITLKDGAAGAGCTVTDNGKGVKTIDCGGMKVTISDGATGPDGASCKVTDNKDGTYTVACGATTVVVHDGAKGDKGAACSVTTAYDGSKIVNCEDGSSVVIVPASSELAWNAPLPGMNVKILSVTGGTGAGGHFKIGDTIAVNFSVKDDAGKDIPLSVLTRARAWLAGPVENYQHILPDAANAYDMKANPAAVTNKDGTLTYAFTAAIPAKFPTQLGSTGAFPQGTLAGNALTDGTYTLQVVARRDFVTSGATVPNAGFAQQNVLVGDNTQATTHAVVADANCNNCHRNVQAHGGGYRSTNLCVTCHTAGAEATFTPAGGNSPIPEPIEFSVLVHKIHDGLHLPSVQGISVDANGNRTYGTGAPFGIGTNDFSTVQFPMFPNFNVSMPKNLGYSALASANKTKEDNLRRGVTNCSACHIGNTAYGRETRRACGACHDDIDFAKAFKKNNQTMNAQANDANCTTCHDDVTTKAAHQHPLDNASINKDLQLNVTAVSGGTQVSPVGNFKAGDKLSATFTIKNGAGTDVPPSALDSVTSILVGPNQNRNVVFPIASASGVQLSPFDVAPRGIVSVGVTSSGSGAAAKSKGAMTKVIEAGTTVPETFKVQFNSAMGFDVTGTTSGALGSGTLAGTSSNPSGGSVGSIVLDPTVTPQNIAVVFSGPTTFTVTGSVSGALGSGTLPSSTSGSVFWKSTDNMISFLVTVGSYAFASGNTINFTIFKGAPNPVLFAVVAGSLDFAAGDRFYYDYLAPAASYTMKVPMEIPWEILGYGNGATLQPLAAAANLPVYYGRQTVYEGTALAATGSVATVIRPYERWAYLTDITGLVANDFLVFEQGNGAVGATEEYLRVSSVDPSTRRVVFSTIFRFQHNPGAVVKKVTAQMLQEGVDYTLNSATGVITLANAKTVAATNPVFMTYRTDGAFGWRMKAGGSLMDIYGPAINESGTFAGDAWQVWTGRKYIDGTYNFSIWGYMNMYFADQGEAQTYRVTSMAAQKDFLYGAATKITPQALIESPAACAKCHGSQFSFHGGGRRGGDACLTCHGTAGLENGNGTNYRFSTFLHSAHAEALPSMPGGAKDCAMCHGTATTWKQPTDHSYPGASLPANNYAPACTGCHDVISAAGGAHIDAMVSPITKVESCPVCHAPDRDLPPEKMHAVR